MAEDLRKRRDFLSGFICSDKIDKSVVVEVRSKVIEPRYKKFVNKKKKYMAHDPQNKCRTGDLVEIMQSRPLSASKRWVVTRIINRAPEV